MYASSSLIYFDQLANLCTRSKFEYFLIGVWSNTHSLTTATPMMCIYEEGGEFITQYLKLKPAMLAKHFNTYAMNCGGIPGDITTAKRCIHLRADDVHNLGIVRALVSNTMKSDKKTLIKAVIMLMLHKQYCQ
jgi:hypothetical protein